MMWPFSKDRSLRNSGIFSGFTDWHSHILPGVDDGIMSVGDSIAVLRKYEELGISRVWLTPHIMEDYPNTTQDLRTRFSELKEAYDGGVELRLGSENMLDALFEERLAAKDLLPIGEDGDRLLVETSYFTPPMGMEGMLERIRRAGYYPVMAHPERYRYMDRKDYVRLREMGIRFQVNLLSFVGGYGEVARKKAEWLLDKDMADVAGSDLHRLETFDRGINKDLKEKYISKIQRLC